MSQKVYSGLNGWLEHNRKTTTPLPKITTPRIREMEVIGFDGPEHIQVEERELTNMEIRSIIDRMGRQ
jgi:hypothetical protein